MKRILSLCAVLLFASAAWAGISPKPQMNFNFIYNISPAPEISVDLSEQIQCSDSLCLEEKPIGEEGIQKLYCTAANCFSVAYEYDYFQKLVIYFTDGTKRESNVFKTPGKLHSAFNVYVNENSLTVEETALPKRINLLLRTDAWISLVLLLVLELLAASAFLIYTQKSFSILYSVVGANILTVAISWLFLSNIFTGTAVIWLFSLVFEALFVWAVNRRKINLYDSGILSLATNVTSYSVGMMLSYAISLFLF